MEVPPNEFRNEEISKQQHKENEKLLQGIVRWYVDGRLQLDEPREGTVAG
jgi:hypothetical protein